MATVERIILSDSLDPRIKANVETVTFFHPVTGVKLEIELSEKNREHFAGHLDKLEKYIDAARVVEQAPAKAVKVQAGNKAEIREWAKANGYEVGERGRIKAEILNAFEAAQKDATMAKVMGPDEPEVAAESVTEPTVEVTEGVEVIEPQDASESVVDASDLVEVEFPQDEENHPESRKSDKDAFVQFLKDSMTPDGQITAESLASSETA